MLLRQNPPLTRRSWPIFSPAFIDRGTEYCGHREHHEYELYLALEDIGTRGPRTRVRRPTGICERIHKTVRDEFYRLAFRTKVSATVDELQANLDG